MLARLFFAFTTVTLVELYLLVWTGSFIGFWPTLALVLTTGIVGAALAKREGLKVLREWQTALAEMRVPEEGLTGALLVLVAGIFLMTPGLLTDVTGLLLLVPTVRRFVGKRIEARFFPGLTSSPLGTAGPFGAKGPFAGASFGANGPFVVGARRVQVGAEPRPSPRPARVEVVDHGPVPAGEAPALEADVVVDRRGRVVHRNEP
jgi:UPF0716 protein FxsA